MQEMQAYLERVRLITGRIWVKVKPNSPKTSITGMENNILAIQLNAPPENNRANIELIKFLSKATGKEVRIISGFNKRLKLIAII